MVKFSPIVILCLLIAPNLHADDEMPSVELLEFLADWQQEDDEWFDAITSTPAASTKHEVDDESEK